jgi:phosphocarrier protein HPr
VSVEHKHQKHVEITNALGLHLRAAGVLVQVASAFQSHITLSHAGTEANAKSIMGVLALGASKGAVLTVTATGKDAEEALEAVCRIITEGFHGS